MVKRIGRNIVENITKNITKPIDGKFWQINVNITKPINKKGISQTNRQKMWHIKGIDNRQKILANKREYQRTNKRKRIYEKKTP